MIINKNSLKIIGTILAKNEEDIIGINIEHHINHGVTQIIVTDNGSNDRTREIAASYPEVVEIIDEPGEDHNQSKWVTRMAQIACRLNPDWIVHLDADELWLGLTNLKNIKSKYVSSTGMYLHPPIMDEFDFEKMRFYLDFDSIIELPSECKVAHRPDENIIITHGNHGFVNVSEVHFTKNIWRHHYPVRSKKQFVKKSVLGHRALLKRNAICKRWKRWHDLNEKNQLSIMYDIACKSWTYMIENPNKPDFLNLLELWSETEVVDFFRNNSQLPKIGEYPRAIT